jgi:DNA topoisomerase-1
MVATRSNSRVRETTGKRAQAETTDLGTDPLASAREAGLRYVHDAGPGFRRRRCGKGFRYLGADGEPVRDPSVLQRIRSLAIPPAWTDVWICPCANGHIQATGRDDRGRKQYRYHSRWRAVRDETKYDRMIAFGQVLPRIRARIEEDLALPGLPRAKVLATVVRLMEITHIRVGNEEYARHNHSFGLTTLRNRHVDVNGQTIRFSFRGKSGVKHEARVTDRRVARIVQRCQDLPGQELFQYLDEEGNPRAIDSTDVNDYLREAAGQEFTAKDFRTWAGTVLAARALREYETFDSAAQTKRNIVAAIDAVAKHLGNTRTVCRNCYVHPAVIAAYEDGSLLEGLGAPTEEDAGASAAALSAEESAVLAFLTMRQEHPGGPSQPP